MVQRVHWSEYFAVISRSPHSGREAVERWESGTGGTPTACSDTTESLACAAVVASCAPLSPGSLPWADALDCPELREERYEMNLTNT